MQTPLQIFNADVVFYRTDASGAPVGDVWMGETAENLTLSEAPKERVLERSGMPYGEARHEETEFGIEWESVWLHDGVRMPRIVRGARLVMVIVWSEPESGAWNRRTYYGVTARPQRVQSSPMHTVSFRAEWMEEDTGMGIAPVGPLTIPGRVWYCDGEARIEAARVDSESGIVTALDESLVKIDCSTPGALWISINGVLALTADDSGVVVREIVEFSGMAVALRGPRAEFWMGARRLAVLSAAGKLLCSQREVGEKPQLDIAMHFQNPDWLLSLGMGTAWAVKFQETL